MASNPRIVFLVGEGPCDIGDLAHEAQYRKGQEGFFQPLLRRLAAPLQLQFDGRKIVHLPKRSPSRKGRLDHAKKPALALALARDLMADVLVYVRDLDRQQGTRATAKNRANQLREMLDELESTFAMAKHRDPELAGIPVVIAIPAWMLESWVLADPDAIRSVSSRAMRGDAFSGRSEDLWGDEKVPDSDHPKCVLGRLLREKVSTAFYADVANAISFSSLSEQCRDTFPRFVEALQAQGLGESYDGPSPGRPSSAR